MHFIASLVQGACLEMKFLFERENLQWAASRERNLDMGRLWGSQSRLAEPEFMGEHEIWGSQLEVQEV